MGNHVSSESLNWGLLHLDLEADSDLFPRPFEIDAIKASWPSLLGYLRTLDIATYQWQGARKLLIPKDEYSFRHAIQLDPIDSLVFAAIVREVGDAIEPHRIPIAEAVVFSYRFEPTPTGRLFGETSRWDDFWRTSVSRAQASDFIVTTDITDFYNQIYHHC